ncbi:MAG: lysozyme [Phage 65_10]|nr:MAG: lysozyme [Phage 65_10]
MQMNLIDQLRRDEGEKLTAYQDHLGFWTIGVGVLIDARKNGGITAEESAMLLANRVKSKESGLRAALPWFDGLDRVRQAALLNMAYQLGVAGVLGFPRMLDSLRDQRWADAEAQALDSRWAKEQTPERARRVARQFATGEWQ